MMNRLFKAMESAARMATCSTNPEGYSLNKLSKPQQVLHVSALFFDFVDFFDMIFDTVEGFRITFSGERPMFGVFLLGGIVIARIIASKGKRVLLNGGLQWAPFFQDRREFYQRVGPNTALPALFALLFTEISVFMFEDATMLSIWIATQSFEKSDIFDRLNLWFTLLSMAICLSLLLGSILAWLRLWKWEKDACSIACQLLSALSFLVIFGIIIMFLVWLVLAGFQTVTGKEEIEGANPFLILVVLSWTFGSFFACTLRQENRVPRVQSASWREDGPNNDGCGEPQDDTLSDLESGSRPNSDPSSSSEPVSSEATEEQRESDTLAIAKTLTPSVVKAGSDVPFVEAVLLDNPREEVPEG